jgi:hypothetical protein
MVGLVQARHSVAVEVLRVEPLLTSPDSRGSQRQDSVRAGLVVEQRMLRPLLWLVKLAATVPPAIS